MKKVRKILALLLCVTMLCFSTSGCFLMGAVMEGVRAGLSEWEYDNDYDYDYDYDNEYAYEEEPDWDSGSMWDEPEEEPDWGGSGFPDPEEPTEPPMEIPAADTDETWAVYWYLCGSDLETDSGAATDDLIEMTEAALPENVTVVVETGGARRWQNDVVEDGVLGRYVYNSEGLRLVEELPEANMGDADTLGQFLSFCVEHYPADRTMVLFWNHGGGSVTGAAFDECYWYDSLTLDEMYQGFAYAFEPSLENPPVEVVGFDTCLMATVDTAYTFCDLARYLVASEEMEPGCGWDYQGWLQALGNDPSMDGAELGQVICDSYLDGCEMLDVDYDITLSVTDLQQFPALLNAYDAMGREALMLACERPTFFTEFARGASRAENYGGNNEDEGYTNMVDLGDLVRQNEELLAGTAQPVLNALEQCVVYQVKGPYRQEASGLSCYYSYNSDEADLEGYLDIGASEAFKQLYSYSVYGELSEEGQEYLNSFVGIEETPELVTVDAALLDEYPLYVDDYGCAVLDLGPEIAAHLQGVYFQLCCYSMEDDIILLLGRDNDLVADWENGVFWDNFRGVWGSIDGYYCYMELTYEGDDYNIYAVPILLNGEEYNLRVVYDFTIGEYQIMGARKGLDETGKADRLLRKLRPGDEITTLHYAMTISGDDDFTMVPVDTFEVTEDTCFYEEEVGDGEFLMMFEMVDAYGEMYYSEWAFFTVEGEDIFTWVE